MTVSPAICQALSEGERDSGNKNQSEGLVSGADCLSTALSAALAIRGKRAGVCLGHSYISQPSYAFLLVSLAQTRHYVGG